jgi:hypothetical protein
VSRINYLFLLGLFSIGCDTPPPPDFTLEDVSAVRNADGHVEVRGFIRNAGGPQMSALCVRAAWVEVADAGAGGAAPGDDSDRFIDARERCYADGIDEGDVAPFAVTLGETRAGSPDQRIDVELTSLESSAGAPTSLPVPP